MNLPADAMLCPECGKIAYSESVDVGVGLIVEGNFVCECGWESEADGKMNVGSYSDYFE
jgi:lysyl-tRNA synthetase class I